MKLKTVFSGTPVTLNEILERKSARAERQKALLAEGSPCLISFSLNIAGNVKQFPFAEAAFEEGLAQIGQLLGEIPVLLTETFHGNTGPEVLLSVAANPKMVKEKMAALEESHPLGRLFDIDVLGPDGLSLSRSCLGLSPRPCLICGENAKICARSRAHSIELIQWKTASILEQFFRDRAADRAAACAVRALLSEVSATPKPGLVDRANSGSHRDMDFFTFVDSSAALTPWFREFFCIGWDFSGESPARLFPRLRFAGERAEEAMFAATGGVNTHKGLIFSFAILCGALGSVRAGQGIPLNAETVLELCRQLGTCSLRDFSGPAGVAEARPQGDPEGENRRPKTAGETCFCSHGFPGARGEAARGFPAAVTLGVPTLKSWLQKGLSLNDAAVLTLLSLIAAVDDTNMIHRGGADAAARCKAEAGQLLAAITPEYNKKESRLRDSLLAALDADYIRRNLSPGGCADLLAVSLMLYFLEESGFLTPVNETGS